MNEEKLLIKIVDEALDRLYTNEKILFKENSSERNRVFHFARYFIDILKEQKIFEECDVDCEYNRDYFNEKKYKEVIYEGKEHRIFPDFILHKRGSNKENKLAIEFKNTKNLNKIDKYKLEALTSEEGSYNYKLGLFIKFNKLRKNVRIIKFKNGRKY